MDLSGSGGGAKENKTVSQPGKSTVGENNASVSVEEYVRVPVSRINVLLNLVGEVVINKMKSSHKVVLAKRLVRFSREAQKRFSMMAEKFKETYEGQDQTMIHLMDHCQADYERIKGSFKDLYDHIAFEGLSNGPGGRTAAA